MILYLFIFLAGGCAGAFFMSLLLSGKKEDARWSEACENLKYCKDYPDHAGSVHVMAVESD